MYMPMPAMPTIKCESLELMSMLMLMLMLI